MRKRRIELSGTYVVASTLATVTGAVVASFFGVYGTIIGSAVVSVASTAGAAFYQATLQRGREQIVQIGPVVASRARAAAHSVRHGGPEDTTLAGYAYPGEADPGRGNGGPRRGDSDNGAAIAADATAPQQAVHRLRTGDPGVRGETPGAQGAASAADAQSAGDAQSTGDAESAGDAQSAGDAHTAGEARDTTEALDTGQAGGVQAGGAQDGGAQDGGADSSDQGGAARNGTEGAAQPVHGAAGGNGSLWSRIGWKRVGATAAAVFVVAIGVITVIELLAGKPMGAILGGQKTSGTSVGSVFSGQPAATPSTGQPSPNVSRQRNNPATGSAQPTNPSPAPSTSTSRTSGPSPTPSAPGPSTAPGNGPPPSAPIPPIGDPTGGTAQGGGRGTSAQNGPTP